MLVYLIILVYALGCAYATWQLMWWLKRTRWGHRHELHNYAFLLIAVDCILIMAAMTPECTAEAHLQKFSNIWLGLFAVFAVCLALAHITKHFIHMVSTRQSAVILGTMAAITIGFNLLGFIHAQQIFTHYYAVRIDANGAELLDEQVFNNDRESLADYRPEASSTGQTTHSGYNTDATFDTGQATRIVLLADMHMGVNTHYSTIKHLVDITKAAHPDAIIGGGDYFTSSYIGLFGADRYAALLAAMLDDGTPAYMAYGNHDVTEPLFCGFAVEPADKAYRSKNMDNFFKCCNWKMLEDEMVEIDGIQFYFRKDCSKTGDGRNVRLGMDAISQAVDDDKPLVVVEHEPKNYAELSDIGAELALSGHTHDGQVWPGTWLTRLIAENSHGYKDIGKVATIVSSGVGYFGPPMRVGSHSEIVVVDLVKM